MASTAIPTDGVNTTYVPNRSNFPSSNALPSIVATVVVVASVVLLIAGIKLCGYKRTKSKESTGKAKKQRSNFMGICRHHSSEASCSSAARRNVGEYIEESTIQDADEQSDSDSTIMLQEMLNRVQQAGLDGSYQAGHTETVQVEVHESSDEDSIPTLPSTSTPQNMVPPRRVKPFRLTVVTENAIYDIA